MTTSAVSKEVRHGMAWTGQQQRTREGGMQGQPRRDQQQSDEKEEG